MLHGVVLKFIASFHVQSLCPGLVQSLIHVFTAKQLLVVAAIASFILAYCAIRFDAESRCLTLAIQVVAASCCLLKKL